MQYPLFENQKEEVLGSSRLLRAVQADQERRINSLSPEDRRFVVSLLSGRGSINYVPTPRSRTDAFPKWRAIIETSSMVPRVRGDLRRLRSLIGGGVIEERLRTTYQLRGVRASTTARLLGPELTNPIRRIKAGIMAERGALLPNTELNPINGSPFPSLGKFVKGLGG